MTFIFCFKSDLNHRLRISGGGCGVVQHMGISFNSRIQGLLMYTIGKHHIVVQNHLLNYGRFGACLKIKMRYTGDELVSKLPSLCIDLCTLSGNQRL
mgnify:CR=1 FL=1